MRIDLLSFLAASLLLASPALAQDEEGGETTEGKDFSAGDYGAEDYRGDATATEATETEAAHTGGYPAAEIDRPLVLPPMMLEVRGGGTFSRISRGVGALTSRRNWVGLFAGGGMGIMEDLEAGVGGGFFASGPGLGAVLMLSPEFYLGDLPLYGMYDLTKILGIPNLQIAGRVILNLPLQDATSDSLLVSALSDFAVLADAPAKYKINDKLALVGSAGIGAQMGGVDGLLVELHAGGLVQATEQLAVQFTLGMLAIIAGDSTALIPLSVRGEYSLTEVLDAFGDLSFVDLNNMGADWFLFQAGVAYRLGM